MHRPLIAPGLVLGLALTAAGCADPVERSNTWGYLHASIIEPNCATANCHSHTTQQADLDLSDPDDAYFSLTQADCGEDPFDDSNSYVVRSNGVSSLELLLHGDAGGEYPQMPVDLPLAPGEIAMIEHWIDEGALCQP